MKTSIVEVSVVEVSRQPLRQHSSEVDSMSEAIPRRVLTAQLTDDKHHEMVLAKPNLKHLPPYGIVTRKCGGSSDRLHHHGQYKNVDYGAQSPLNASHGEQVNSVFVMSVSATQQRNLYLGLWVLGWNDPAIGAEHPRKQGGTTAFGADVGRINPGRIDREKS